jgi:alpha-D-xyloside xylohydrolase
LYVDEGINYNYEKGNFSEIPFYWNEKLQTLTIGDRKGNFAGTMKSRTFNLIIINKEKQSGMEYGFSPVKTIKYSGRKTTYSIVN